MHRIAVIGRVGNWHWSDLCRAAPSKNIELVAIEFESLVASISNSKTSVSGNQRELADFDGVLIRSMPRGTLEQIVFRMDAVAELERLSVRVVNSTKTIECCVDKYATLCKLKRIGIPIPVTCVCQTRQAAMMAFEELGNDVVMKPIFGSEGRGIVRLREGGLASRLFQVMEENGQAIYLQQFIDHAGWDLRLLVVGSQLYAMKRASDCDWRLNAARGASTLAHRPTSFETELAFESAKAVGATVCGIDLLYDRRAQPFVVELNAAPGWKHISMACQTDMAEKVLGLFTPAANR